MAKSLLSVHLEKGVALMGCNRTGLPCSAGRRTAHAPGRRHATVHEHGGRPSPHAGSITDDDKRCQQTTLTDDNADRLSSVSVVCRHRLSLTVVV